MGKTDENWEPTPRHTGRGRPSRYVPNDPSTWPKHFIKKHEKAMYLLDVLIGDTDPSFPKAKYLLEESNVDYIKRIGLDDEMLSTCADIQGMAKMGSFAFLPTAVIDMLLDKYPKAIPFDHDTVRDPDPSIRGWNDTTIVRIALEVLRLYLMGMDPYFRRVKKSAMLYAKQDAVTLWDVCKAIEHSAKFHNQFEYPSPYDEETLQDIQDGTYRKDEDIDIFDIDDIEF